MESTFYLIEKEAENQIGKTNLLSQLLNIFNKFLILDYNKSESLRYKMLEDRSDPRYILNSIFSHSKNTHIKKTVGKILDFIDDTINKKHIEIYI